MKVAHVAVNFPPHIGGIGEVCFSEAHGLALRGHDVTVFTLRHGRASRSTTPLSKVRTVYIHPLLRGGDAGFVPQLLWSLRGFDIIHLHYPFYGGAEWVYAASKLLRCPYVMTYHMDAQPEEAWKAPLKKAYDRLVAPRIFKGADRVFVVSDDFMEQTEMKSLLSNTHVEVLPNAVDTEVFYPSHTYDYESLGLDRWRDKDALVFVGNLMPLKRLDVLIRAMESLPSRVGLIVIGGGYESDRYKRMVEERGLMARVLFVGPCYSAKKLAQYYNIASIVVVPSDYESFSLVTVEAQASGTIVVASDIPGLRNKISDGVDGFLFEPGSVESLVKKINVALALSDAQKRAVEKAARLRVQNQYALEPHIDKLEKQYIATLAQRV